MHIRPARNGDKPAIWNILEPMIREAETFPLSCGLTEWEALDYWFADKCRVYVADDDGRILGTYHLKPNQGGPGAHVANGGYVTAPHARGRGIARAMCMHSMDEARRLGYRAMQYNLVVGANEAAMHLWQSCGMEIVGRLPGAFHHPRRGDVDAFVMFKTL